jgi:hypothetical protein
MLLHIRGSPDLSKRNRKSLKKVKGKKQDRKLAAASTTTDDDGRAPVIVVEQVSIV